MSKLALNRLSLRHHFLLLLFISAIIFVSSHPAIPQDLPYMNFADARPMLSIPNFYNVASNLLFLIFGLLGLKMLLPERAIVRYQFQASDERLPYLMFFLGMVLTCFGSSYFHYRPEIFTLIWDRLAMTVVFMSFMSITLTERINMQLGIRSCLPLIALGASSVFYWYYTETINQGDLRFYFFIQFFPMLLFPIIILFCRSRYSGTGYYIAGLACYATAKWVEIADVSIYQWSNHWVSGHTLKHLIAAGPAIVIMLYLKHRQYRGAR